MKIGTNKECNDKDRMKCTNSVFINCDLMVDAYIKQCCDTIVIGSNNPDFETLEFMNAIRESLLGIPNLDVSNILECFNNDVYFTCDMEYDFLESVIEKVTKELS